MWVTNREPGPNLTSRHQNVGFIENCSWPINVGPRAAGIVLGSQTAIQKFVKSQNTYPGGVWAHRANGGSISVLPPARGYALGMSLLHVLVVVLTLVAWSELGGPSGKSFRLVRACVRAVCMSSEIGVKFCGPGLSLFPFASLCFPFSLPPPPKLLSSFSWLHRFSMGNALLPECPALFAALVLKDGLQCTHERRFGHCSVCLWW